MKRKSIKLKKVLRTVIFGQMPDVITQCTGLQMDQVFPSIFDIFD